MITYESTVSKQFISNSQTISIIKSIKTKQKVHNIIGKYLEKRTKKKLSYIIFSDSIIFAFLFNTLTNSIAIFRGVL